MKTVENEGNKIMKTIKSLPCIFAAITALAFFTPNAKAILTPGIAITTNFSALSVSITVITNGPEFVSGSGRTLTGVIGKSTINNTFLLNLFGHWANTNWPSGSKLEISWDLNQGTNGGDVVVTDKTGTNVLYDASAGTNNYFIVYYFLDPGASYLKGTATGTNIINPESASNSYSSFTYTTYDDGYCELLDNNVYLPYTDLYLFGGATVTFTQNWSTQNVPTTWSGKADLTSADNANNWFLDIQYTTASGTVDTSGSGKGLNNYFYGP